MSVVTLGDRGRGRSRTERRGASSATGPIRRISARQRRSLVADQAASATTSTGG
jgi:hypothetical protein